MMVLVVILAILGALGLLMAGAYLLLRNPELERENRALKAQNGQWGALLGRLRDEAERAADVNPVAQVFLDEINQAGIPAPIRRKQQ